MYGLVITCNVTVSKMYVDLQNDTPTSSLYQNAKIKMFITVVFVFFLITFDVFCVPQSF